MTRFFLPFPTLLLLLLVTGLLLWGVGCGPKTGTVIWLDDSGKEYQRTYPMERKA